MTWIRCRFKNSTFDGYYCVNLGAVMSATKDINGGNFWTVRTVDGEDHMVSDKDNHVMEGLIP